MDVSSSPMLIASPSGWRDACFLLPAARALAGVRPISILCNSAQAAFWQSSDVGDVVAHDETIKGILSVLPEVEQVLLWEDGPAAKACAKAKIPERTGLPAPGLAKRLTRPIELMVASGPPEHRVRRFLETVAALGADPMKPENFKPLSASTARDPNAILIVPDSDYGRHHEWPVDRWREIIGHPKGQRVLLADGPIARELELETIDLVNPLRAAEFGLCIAADGSIPHIAAAFGTRCAVLYGPGDPALIRPLGKEHTVIRHKVECSPCFADKCLMDGRCQEDLTVDRVRTLLSPLVTS